MRHTILNGLVVLVITAGLGPVHGEGPAPDPFAISLTVGWQNRCRTGEWNPMEITLSSQTDKPFVGSVVVSAPQDTQHQMVIQRPVVLLPAQSIKITLAAKFSFASDACRIRLVDRNGYTVYDQKYELFDYHSNQGGMQLVNSNQILLGLAGKPGLLIPCPADLNKKRERFITCNNFLQNLPPIWTGYCALDALVLYDPDWSLLTGAQQQALAQWVSNGGRLMIILGAKAIPHNSPISKMIPFTISSPQNTALPPDLLGQLGIDLDKTVELPLWKFPREPLGAGWSAAYRTQTGEPLEVSGPVGYGRVILLGFDPKPLSLNTDKQSQAFWLRQIKLFVDPDRMEEEKDENINAGPWGRQEWSIQNAGGNNILSHLMNIAELEPISIWWILGILGTMAVLIGPVDYLVLKRFNRLPWTYASFMSVLAVFTLGAYFGVEFLRAGENQFRRVYVLDKIDTAPHCWQTGYTGIFASRSEDYPITGFSEDSWWSGITPVQGYYSYGNQGLKSTIECFQQEGNIPVSLPVGIWSMRTLIDEQQAAVFPLTAKVDFDGKNISAKIKNTGSVPINSGAVRLKNDWWEFGRIEPGQTLTVTGGPKAAPSLNWIKMDNENIQHYMYSEGKTILPWLAFSATGTAARTRGIEDYHRNGAVIVYAVTDAVKSCPLSLKGKAALVYNTGYFRLVIPTVQTGSLP